MNMHASIPEEKLTEAYRLLLKMRDNCVKKVGEQYDDPEREAKRDALNIAMTVMGQSIPSHWISVKDRLPENPDELVLVIANGMYENVALKDAYCMANYSPDEGWVLEMYPEFEDVQISHWMPLPEPPKEG